ncbi:hypothetical protein ACJ6WF_43535 [Streptomyces sp. MMS24-I2-30]|uniref:hypothetical protein n=1 Tax=Streptomyces sp. MMS24-I2-30 TaxID=3351564 RepID=UPI003896B2CA
MSRFRFTATKRYGVLLGLAAGSLVLGVATSSASASSASHHDAQPAEKCKVVTVEVGGRADVPGVPAEPGKPADVPGVPAKPGKPVDVPGVPAQPGKPVDEPSGKCVIFVDQHGNRVTPVERLEDGRPSKLEPTRPEATRS